jgi:hypothetical protein
MNNQSDQPPQPSQPQESSLPTEPNERTDFRSIGLGCVLGLLSFLILSFALIIFLENVLFVNEVLTDDSLDIYVGLMCLFIAFAFGVGSYVFLRFAAPKTVIRTFGKLPDLVISRKGTKRGITNQKTIKIFVAAIACIMVYLVTLMVICFTSVFMSDVDDLATVLSAGLTILILLIGLILGLISAIKIYSRTSTN